MVSYRKDTQHIMLILLIYIVCRLPDDFLAWDGVLNLTVYYGFIVNYVYFWLLRKELPLRVMKILTVLGMLVAVYDCINLSVAFYNCHRPSSIVFCDAINKLQWENSGLNLLNRVVAIGFGFFNIVYLLIWTPLLLRKIWNANELHEE